MQPRTDAQIKARVAALLNTEEQLREWRRNNQLAFAYPDKGPLARRHYPKHLEFFETGAKFNERGLFGGNRTGKTFAGGYEMALHLTGLYPEWWVGRRFSGPVKCWAAGESAKEVRDTMQVKLFGAALNHGTGLIPKSKLVKTTPKSGVPEAIDTAYIQHASGGESMITMKSFDQGREAFQSAERHVVWLDEECPMDIYTESSMRIITVNGIIYLTFTPLKGMTELVMEFMGLNVHD